MVMRNVSELRRLFEEVIHPISTIQRVHNYHRRPQVRRSVEKSFSQQTRDQRSYFDQYFNSLYGLNRVELYLTYREMDLDPLTTAVLDTYASACTQANTESGRKEAGRVVWVQAANKEVEKLVTRFLDTIQIDQYAFAIMRAIYAFGDTYEACPGVPNEGITIFNPYDPWQVATIWDGQRRPIGFAQADDRGEPINRDSVSPYWEYLHFRAAPRYRTDLYGAASSLLHNVREYWQELQWVEDKIVIDRLRRRPDRVGVLLDIGGMSAEDSWLHCEEVRRRLYRDQYFDPQISELSSLPTAWGEHRDIVLPKGGDNQTQLVNLPSAGSQGPYDDLQFVLRRYFGSLKFPPAYLGLDLGDTIDRGVPLEKQDVAFAQNCTAPQKVLLMELTRAAMIHLAWFNIDARLDQNQFSLMMMPVSAYQEMERKDLLNMRFDLLERALQLGQDNSWNMNFWIRYVMSEYARMPDTLIDSLLKKEEESVNPEEDAEEVEDIASAGSDFGLGLESNKNSDSYKRLMEHFEKNPDSLDVLNFVNAGSAMASSREVRLPLTNGKNLAQQKKEFTYKELMESQRQAASKHNFAIPEEKFSSAEATIPTSKTSFQQALIQRLGEKAKARMGFWKEQVRG